MHATNSCTVLSPVDGKQGPLRLVEYWANHLTPPALWVVVQLHNDGRWETWRGFYNRCRFLEAMPEVDDRIKVLEDELKDLRALRTLAGQIVQVAEPTSAPDARNGRS